MTGGMACLCCGRRDWDCNCLVCWDCSTNTLVSTTNLMTPSQRSRPRTGRHKDLAHYRTTDFPQSGQHAPQRFLRTAMRSVHVRIPRRPGILMLGLSTSFSRYPATFGSRAQTAPFNFYATALPFVGVNLFQGAITPS